MRFHRPKRRQSASTSTWPPCAVAWSELVRRRCRVDFCFVNNGMDTHHHKGDVAASTISPAIAFLFTRLRIGVHHTSPASGSSALYRGLILRCSLGTGSTDLVHTNAAIQPSTSLDCRNLDMTPDGQHIVFVASTRSEERRVGKEGRSRWSP